MSSVVGGAKVSPATAASRPSCMDCAYRYDFHKQNVLEVKGYFCDQATQSLQSLLRATSERSPLPCELPKREAMWKGTVSGNLRPSA